MPVELNIHIKTPEQSYVERDLEYEGITLHEDDPKLQQLVDQALVKFAAVCNDLNDVNVDVIIKAKMTWAPTTPVRLQNLVVEES
jgi:hypothetical protein